MAQSGSPNSPKNSDLKNNLNDNDKVNAGDAKNSNISNLSTKSYVLLAPGPVSLHPAVREVLAEPMIHHRTPLFDSILKKVLLGLRQVFSTQQPVMMFSSTGSGAMEAALVNVVSPGEKVLCIVSGKFGERWAEMAKVFGCDVLIHKVAWGEAVRCDDVAQILKQNLDIKVILCQACETSTGVVHPIRELAQLTRPMETLLLVDGITAVGAFPLPMDEWGIDGLVAGSQKAFMLPTGLSFLAFSEKAWRRIESAKATRYYFDVRKEKSANEKGETFYSSNVSLIKALAVVLELWQSRGYDEHYAELRQRAQWTRDLILKLGLKNYTQYPSDSLSVLVLPSSIDGQKLREWLEINENLTVMGGQDQVKGKILRIGHMGYLTRADHLQLAAALHRGLSEFGFSPEVSESELLSWADSHWGGE